MSGHSLLVYARRAAGLSQAALARLAGTSQPTLSAYERGTKSPSLAVADRIVEAAGHHLEAVSNLEFVEVPGQHGLHPFWLANEPWRLDPERAFSTVLLPGPEHQWPAPRRLYYLHEREDRARAYELILREGSPTDLLDYIDATLLVDIWKELDLPGPIRRAWQPLIRKALRTSRRRPVPRGAGPSTTPQRVRQVQVRNIRDTLGREGVGE
ncbi:XRE family transcriptional regulator [Nocardioides glacieisoli]|uniref:XRE family transcriptional regulator n=1 Tax=Nocardioides glacieisoli TaxID=1168730 RepID=A0A4Q2RP58_9ACTN|nr:helix-turn-helix transcriptional regulator [Nocardioides glacieisoli]RYB88963.1 XRE family transcriptional regulator [Nocardioides glacieisoli]